MLYETGTFLSLLSALRFPQKIVGNDRNSESSSINIPNGLLPSPGTKLITLLLFSAVMSGCNKLSVTPESRSSTSHQSSVSLFSVLELL